MLSRPGPRRVGLRYCRMSFEDSEEQLRRQAVDVDAICELHDYLTKPEWLFTDEDESGNEDTRYRQRKGQRPGLAALDATVCEMARAGHSVTVVAWVPSRLFRDVENKEHYFRRWARLGDVLVHTKQGVWSPRDPRDRFVSTVVAGADQYYSDDVREKVVRAHDERRLSGLPATGWPGFGHQRACGCKAKQPRCASSEHDHWVEQPEEAERLRDAVGRILNGTNLAAICREWDTEGVPTRLGGQWRLTTLRRVLTSPRLAGILVHNGVELGRSDAIEPILDEPDFRRLCERVDGKRHARPHRGKQLLTGVLVCGVCGSGLNSNMKKGSHGQNNMRIYGCRNDGQCNVKAEAVEAVYIEKLFERLGDERFCAALARTDKESDKLLEELRDQEVELDALKAQAGRLRVDVYVAKSDAISARIEELNRLLNQTASADIAARWIGKANRLRKAWDRMPIDEKRALILAVVGRSNVLPAKKRGRYATPDEVKARLVPLVGTSETSLLRTR
jgi:site-specific DNA recombinase